MCASGLSCESFRGVYFLKFTPPLLKIIYFQKLGEHLFKVLFAELWKTNDIKGGKIDFWVGRI